MVSGTLAIALGAGDSPCASSSRRGGASCHSSSKLVAATVRYAFVLSCFDRVSMVESRLGVIDVVSLQRLAAGKIASVYLQVREIRAHASAMKQSNPPSSPSIQFDNVGAACTPPGVTVATAAAATTKV